MVNCSKRLVFLNLLVSTSAFLRVSIATLYTSRMSSSPFYPMQTEEREGPVWDPVNQIYIGGVVPDNGLVHKMIENNGGTLRLFGYGSLCWNPGAGALAHESVKHTLGRAKGYRRCWAQKSTDHRGVPQFPGIVCTLLKDEEFRRYRNPEVQEQSLTEGVLYEVPPQLVDECLEELDFREKGGYARDVIEVIEDETGETVQALLYRGTVESPAFWPRPLKDLAFAASTITVAHGPSGANEVYLHRLDEFLETTSQKAILQKFDDTFLLARFAKTLKRYQLYFLCGCGSNQHQQLLLDPKSADLINAEDAHVMQEIVFSTQGAHNFETDETSDLPIDVFAGGGNSAILTESGRLYMFGWNDCGQLGTSGLSNATDSPLPHLVELKDLRIKTVALGFNHTLLMEKGTNRVYTFGENARGQCGLVGVSHFKEPQVPAILSNETAVDVAAGLFHSAVVTADGYLITFGCSRFGQSLSNIQKDGFCIGRWKPSDGSKVTKVGCGQRHTVALDDRGRLWTFGDNKYGQLGRDTTQQVDAEPGLVKGECPLLSSHVEVHCGWSHNALLVQDSNGSTSVFGFGRNDKGQLGTRTRENIFESTRIFTSHNIRSISCGSEFTVAVDGDGNIWSCGWNEHGNLGIGTTQDVLEPAHVNAIPVTLPILHGLRTKTVAAAGGAHLLAMQVAVK